MLSEKESKVLNEVGKNPRASFRVLAKKAKLAPATFISYVRCLEQKGIIKGYRAVLDPEKLGYSITAVVDVQAKRSGFFKAEDEIAKLPNVCALYEVTGTYDFFLIARFRHRDELSTFVRNLLAMDNVERTHTRLVVNALKEDFSSMLEGTI